MAHTTEIVRTTQSTDETMEVTIRCCKNRKTDSTLTISRPFRFSPEQIDDMINKHHDRVAAKCDGMGKTRAHLGSVVTQTKVHEG
jgi:hypothetical protein